MIVPSPSGRFVVLCVREDRVQREREWARFDTLSDAERVASQLRAVRCPAVARSLDERHQHSGGVA